jgi:hypothetical protein
MLGTATNNPKLLLPINISVRFTRYQNVLHCRAVLLISYKVSKFMLLLGSSCIYVSASDHVDISQAHLANKYNW